MSTTLAVLTGDLVKSSTRPNPDLDRARKIVVSGWKDVPWMDAIVRGTPEFFRGDSWQMALTDPRLALRASTQIRVRLQAEDLPDTRVAIGIGACTRFDAKRVSRSTGEAFERSGGALDEMPVRRRLALDAGPHDLARSDEIIVDLYDAIASTLTKRQAETIDVALGMEEPTQERIAKALGVTRQTVGETLSLAGWASMSEALDYMESRSWTA